jgi:uncharacterized membrane protein YfcA
MLLHLTTLHWVLALLAALFVGLNKAGITGIDVIMVTLLIFIFGGRASTGILMPLLIVGDIMAVSYYHRHTQWKYLKRLLPWMIAGVLTGVYIGKDLPEITFRQWMSGIILLTTVMLFWWMSRKNQKVPDNKLFAGTMGFAAGFTTMVGNLAGAFSNIFFLAMKLPKEEFIGTASWLFCIINLIKLPFHVFVWKTISTDTLMVDLKLLPAIILGFVLGVTVIKKTPDELFRKSILVLTAIGAIVLFFRR